MQIQRYVGDFEGILPEFLDIKPHIAYIFEIFADKRALEGVEIENIRKQHGLLHDIPVSHLLFETVKD